MYAELQKINKKIKFVEGLPDSFEDENLFPSDQTHLVILDDVIFQASNHPEVSHSIDIIEIWALWYWPRMFFYQGKFSRTINLNFNCMILFKNPRDRLQINVLAQQMFPTQEGFFL